MTDRHDADNDRELAQRLRVYLGSAVRPVDAERLVDGLEARAARPSGLQSWMAAAAVATVLVAAIGTVAAVGFLSRPTTPVASGHASASPPPTSSGQASATPTPQPSPTASATTLLTGNAVDEAGSTGQLGIWARRGSVLYLSTDGGTSWTTGPIDPAPYAVDVLDVNYAWTVTLAAGSSKDTGSPTDVLHFEVNRTHDGGKTWASVEIDGSFGAMKPVLSFPDAIHGFLLFSRGRFANQESTVYRTEDGGATWRKVGAAASLGPVFVAQSSLVLFAGAAESAAPVKLWPALEWSQDGGATWHAVQISSEVTALLQPPTFFESFGMVPVTDAFGSVRLWGTNDGGASWSEIQRGLYVGPIGPGAFLNPDFWILASRDGYGDFAVITRHGTKWDALMSTGLPIAAPSWIGFADPDHGALLAPLGDTPAPPGLFVTSDGGKTWTPAQLPPN